MTAIVLPPRPITLSFMSASGELFAYTADQLRARDLEIVRLMLEAAAQAAQPDDSYRDEWFAAKADAVKRIRALEVRHHE